MSQDFKIIAEINPPELPSNTHLELAGRWNDVLITDNIFGKVRVSPYAYAARITHDLPDIKPTVVVSTRDRNILAIESEVRGALANGVESFLVVIGDTRPEVDHLSHHYEVVEHLRKLQTRTPAFQVGMPTRFRKWQYRKRIDLGAQFFVAGPIIDPATIEENLDRLDHRADDPPLYVMVQPPFSARWIETSEQFGCVAATDGLKQRVAELDRSDARAFAWERANDVIRSAQRAGCAGAILTGLAHDTVTHEAPGALRLPD